MGVTWKREGIERKETQSVMRDGCKAVEQGRPLESHWKTAGTPLESDLLRIAAWEEAVFCLLSVIILSFTDFTEKQSSGFGLGYEVFVANAIKLPVWNRK